MLHPHAKQLFKAVEKADTAAIRKLLDAGVPLESQDHERMTPLLRAAQRGQLEVFQLLLDAGADVNAVGMGPTDALEMAASGGNVQIIRLLLDQGVPLEGHGKLNSPVLKRMGHMTPLICAAIEGHVEAVRVLLEAGANRDAKFDGDTALKMVKSEIKHPLFSESEADKHRYREVAALLAETDTVNLSDEVAASLEVDRFARNVKQLGYKQLFKDLEKHCGKARKWKPVQDHGIAANGVVRFTLRRCRDEYVINELQENARLADCQLILAEPWIEGEDAQLVLFPTNDKFTVVAVVGTEGSNDSVHTDDIIRWLRELDKDNPFHIRHCSHEMVGGEFLAAVKGATKVAEQMVELCPGVLGDECETVSRLAAVIKKEKGFLMRWD